MEFTKKCIQLLAISPERGVAFARYKNNGIYGIGPPFFELKAVKNWEAILSRLGDSPPGRGSGADRLMIDYRCCGILTP